MQVLFWFARSSSRTHLFRGWAQSAKSPTDRADMDAGSDTRQLEMKEAWPDPQLQPIVRRKKLGRPALFLNKRDITALLHMPQPAAAQQLRVSLSSLKRECRRLGIRHWPYKRSGKNLIHPDTSPDQWAIDINLPSAQACSSLFNVEISVTDTEVGGHLRVHSEYCSTPILPAQMSWVDRLDHFLLSVPSTTDLAQSAEFIDRVESQAFAGYLEQHAADATECLDSIVPSHRTPRIQQ